MPTLIKIYLLKCRQNPFYEKEKSCRNTFTIWRSNKDISSYFCNSTEFFEKLLGIGNMLNRLNTDNKIECRILKRKWIIEIRKDKVWFGKFITIGLPIYIKWGNILRIDSECFYKIFFKIPAPCRGDEYFWGSFGIEYPLNNLNTFLMNTLCSKCSW